MNRYAERKDGGYFRIARTPGELWKVFLKENPQVCTALNAASTLGEFHSILREMVNIYLNAHPNVEQVMTSDFSTREEFERLTLQDYAAIRIFDFIRNSGREFADLNFNSRKVISAPFQRLFNHFHNKKPLHADFLRDMIHLFRQFRGECARQNLPKETIIDWMNRYPSGLDPEVIQLHEANKRRILEIIINRIDAGRSKSRRFLFVDGLSSDEKMKQAMQWWIDFRFHLAFAARTPDQLNEFLDHSLSSDTLDRLKLARKRGIPFFVNLNYLSLVLINPPAKLQYADLAIRDYMIYSEELIESFGNISAWEKEDIVEPGKPNAAGWILPSHRIHRRYPTVAIMIPETMGRACAGLCASCQRMYDFQRGNLNFEMNDLKPRERWPDQLRRDLAYFEKDSQLRDILLTGGDALMSSVTSLRTILNEVYAMLLRKRVANIKRKNGRKYAEIQRVRLGTRLPVYLPQRINGDLINVLANFKRKAITAGVRQFVIQTHFESPLEITPDAEKAVKRLLSSGWIVTNQLVFTAAASRRGHTAKLRKVLNDIGVLTYYTFTVKGFMENHHNFATNARAVQEQIEEKMIGHIPEKYRAHINDLTLDAEHIRENIDKLRDRAGLPFLATDRNVLNLPAVGKSLTFRTIGLTRDGRRILEFDHEHLRKHSPIIEKMGKVVVVESKSISKYLEQLIAVGENSDEYQGIFGYSMGVTEPLMPIFRYPEYDFCITDYMTNLDI